MAKETKKVNVNYYDSQNPNAVTEIGYVNGIRVEVNLNEEVEVNEGIKEMFDYAHNAQRKFDKPVPKGKITPEEASPRAF